MSSSQNRPIVYSGRYYSPPGKPRRQSYWHLYRIHPDGTGRQQLTDGPCNDVSPCWSPDGRQIAFVREPWQRRDEGLIRVCVWDRSSTVRTVYSSEVYDITIRWLDTHTLFIEEQFRRRLGNGRCIDVRTGAQQGEVFYGGVSNFNCIRPSPDGRWLLLDSDIQGSDTVEPVPPRLVRVSDGKSITLPAQLHRDDAVVCDGTWLTADRLVVFQDHHRIANLSRPDRLVEISGEGRVLRSVPIVVSRAKRYPQLIDERIGGAVHRLPGCRDAVLCPGSVPSPLFMRQGWNAWFLVNLGSGQAQFWAQGGDLAFSPDGRQFVTSYGERQATLGKRPDPVYVCPLRIAPTAQPERQRTLVDGLVHVDSADWCPV